MSFINSDIQGYIIKVSTYNIFSYLSFGKLIFALNQFYVLYFSLTDLHRYPLKTECIDQCTFMFRIDI